MQDNRSAPAASAAPPSGGDGGAAPPLHGEADAASVSAAPAQDNTGPQPDAKKSPGRPESYPQAIPADGKFRVDGQCGIRRMITTDPADDDSAVVILLGSGWVESEIGRIELLAARQAANRQPEMVEVHDRSIAYPHG